MTMRERTAKAIGSQVISPIEQPRDAVLCPGSTSRFVPEKQQEERGLFPAAAPISSGDTPQRPGIDRRSCGTLNAVTKPP